MLSQRFLVNLICWLAVALVAGCSSSEPTTTEATGATASERQSQKIAILFRDAEDPYSRAIRDGITIAAQEFDLQLEWMPTSADDSRRQLELLRKAIDEHFRAICIAPIAAEDLVQSLEEAAEAGIPVVALERALPKAVPLVSFVSTDHFHLGRIVAQHVARQLEPGKLLLVNGSADDAADIRRQGFRYALNNSDLNGVKVVECNCQQSTRVLQDALQQHDDVVAIVALDTPGAAAAVQLVVARQLDVKVYGYGAWSGIASDIQQQHLTATVLEDPYIIGYSSMLALSTHFDGGENLEFIMPEPTIVTAGNLDEENVKRLLESNMIPLLPAVGAE